MIDLIDTVIFKIEPTISVLQRIHYVTPNVYVNFGAEIIILSNRGFVSIILLWIKIHLEDPAVGEVCFVFWLELLLFLNEITNKSIEVIV